MAKHKTIKPVEIDSKYKFQGPRYKKLGDVSGEEFAEEIVIPFIDREMFGFSKCNIFTKERLILDFTGTLLFSPSFLDETIKRVFESGYVITAKNMKAKGLYPKDWSRTFKERQKFYWKRFKGLTTEELVKVFIEMEEKENETKG